MKYLCVVLYLLIVAARSVKIQKVDEKGFDNKGDDNEEEPPPITKEEKEKNKRIETGNSDKQKQPQNEQLLPSATVGRFWHISDLHLDFYYNQYNRGKAVCPSSNGEIPIQPGPYGDYRCDSPWTLINSSIYAMKLKYPDPDFILWTGDDTLRTNDEGRYLSEDLVLESIKNVSRLIQTVFPNVKVYSALGNHDYYPKNQMPIGPSSFLSNVADIWNKWFTLIESVTFEDGGFYSGVNEKFPNLHVIVLNTNLWHSSNKAINTTAETDPGSQFEFLKSTLENVHEGSKIYIIGHIPPGYYELADGISWLHPQYSAKYIELVKRYSDRIAGQFFGHHHTDSFRIFNDENGNALSSLWITPGVSPRMVEIPGSLNNAHNPGIRLFEFSKATLQPTDYHQFYLDLQKANSDGKGWRLEYTATKAYGIKDLNPLTMGDLYKKIKNANPLCKACKENQLVQDYHKFNSVSYSDAACDSRCQRYHACAISELKAKGYQDCVADGASQAQITNVWYLVTISLMISLFFH